ncbi:MAG: tRNA pseudouridine(55) synthase TruB [bacterium]
MSRAAAGVDGVVLLDKPAGMTSNGALQRVRTLYGRPKGGHTGTLDPLATGLLPICLGEATKFAASLLNEDKSYEAAFRLGYRSSTGDAEGKLELVAAPDFNDWQLHSALKALTGKIEQTPPMYSAVKVGGRPLYRHARQGRTVERPARSVHIRRLDLLERQAEELRLVVICSKGTYIRVLAEELGARLGCGAYLGALRRTAIGRFAVEDAVALPALEAMDMVGRTAVLLPVDALLYALPRLELSADAGSRVLRGLPAGGLEGFYEGLVRLYAPSGRFLGVGEADGKGKVTPKRLVAERLKTGLTL